LICCGVGGASVGVIFCGVGDVSVRVIFDDGDDTGDGGSGEVILMLFVMVVHSMTTCLSCKPYSFQYA